MLSLYKVIRSVNILFNKDCFDLNEVNKEGVAPNTELWNNINTTYRGVNKSTRRAAVNTTTSTTAGGEDTATNTTSGGKRLEVLLAAADIESFMLELGSY